MNKHYVIYMYNGILLNHNEEWSPDTYSKSKTDWFREHNVKGNKPDLERQNPHCISCVKVYKR